jgi:hypothetical protein
MVCKRAWESFGIFVNVSTDARGTSRPRMRGRLWLGTGTHATDGRMPHATVGRMRPSDAGAEKVVVIVGGVRR